MKTRKCLAAILTAGQEGETGGRNVTPESNDLAGRMAINVLGAALGSLSAYPSLTEFGRARAHFDVSLRWEIIKNLFRDLRYYNTDDSDLPSGSLSTNDYGVVTSIEWSF